MLVQLIIGVGFTFLNSLGRKSKEKFVTHEDHVKLQSQYSEFFSWGVATLILNLSLAAVGSGGRVGQSSGEACGAAKERAHGADWELPA